MNIKFLIENKPSDKDLIQEHGLSIYIESNNKKILFDSGASSAFAKNAEKMGVNLEDIDIAIASHGHYDHTGGFPYFFKVNKKAKLYIHQNAFNDSYAYRNGKINDSNSGIRWSDEEKAELENRIIYTSGREEIAKNIWITGTMKTSEGFIPVERFYYKDKDNELVEDDFSHEQALVIKENDGICVFSGCCHKGALTSIEAAKEIYPNKHIKVLVAGLHLYRGTKEDRIRVSNELNEQDISKIYPVHCTGEEGIALIKNTIGDKCVVAACGDEYYGC